MYNLMLEDIMEEYQDIIYALKVTLIIPIIYIIGYLIKGRERNIGGFFKAICSSFVLYASSFVPMFFFLIFKEIEGIDNTIIELFMGIFSFLMFAPSFKVLIESMDRDYKVSYGFKDSMMSVLLYSVLIIFMVMILSFILTGFISGNMSLTAFLVGLSFPIGIGATLTLIILKKYLKEKTDDLNTLIGFGMIIYFSLIVFVGVIENAIH